MELASRILKIAFIWYGVRGRVIGVWDDGLHEALRHIGKIHTVQMFEPEETEAIMAFQPDVVLYWAASTEQTMPLVTALPFKKAMLFGGGPVEPHIMDGFDMYFVESEINEKEFSELGYPWRRAFGINERLFFPDPKAKKIYNGSLIATFALWKRHHLFAEAVGARGIAVGMMQDHEPECHMVCRQYGVQVVGESPKEYVNQVINSSHSVINTAGFWGGGQRLTLEAMACNVPPIVMDDSPKNCEYVQESGFGYIVPPNPLAIREAIDRAKTEKPTGGRAYIESKWTSQHYATALLSGIQEIL